MDRGQTHVKVLLALFAVVSLVLVVYLLTHKDAGEGVATGPVPGSGRLPTPQELEAESGRLATSTPIPRSRLEEPREATKTAQSGGLVDRIADFCIKKVPDFLQLASGQPPANPEPISTIERNLTGLATGEIQLEGIATKEEVYYWCRMFADRVPMPERRAEEIRSALEPLRKAVEFATVSIFNDSEQMVFVGDAAIRPRRQLEMANVEIPGAWYPGCGASFTVRVGEGSEEVALPYHVTGNSVVVPPGHGRTAMLRWTRFTTGEQAGRYQLQVCEPGSCPSR